MRFNKGVLILYWLKSNFIYKLISKIGIGMMSCGYPLLFYYGSKAKIYTVHEDNPIGNGGIQYSTHD